MEKLMEITEKPAQPTLSIHFHASVEELPAKLGETYGAIMQYMGELGENPVGPPFAAFYNMDMQNLEIQAGFPVSREYPEKGSIIYFEIPAGEYGSYLYTGPYAECGPAYEALAAYVKGKGYEPSGVAYEYYLNDPNESPGVEPQTLIVYPLMQA
jgi:effector-binding domain-containing protein